MDDNDNEKDFDEVLDNIDKSTLDTETKALIFIYKLGKAILSIIGFVCMAILFVLFLYVLHYFLCIIFK